MTAPVPLMVTDWHLASNVPATVIVICAAVGQQQQESVKTINDALNRSSVIQLRTQQCKNSAFLFDLQANAGSSFIIIKKKDRKRAK